MPPRNRTPLHFGEGLDRESGLMVQTPSRFEDLRNVILDEGAAMLRPGFSAAGATGFDEVDRLVAGEALRTTSLGVIVGYDTTTRRVYVYRATPDLSIVELVEEWVHDLPGGWGSEIPRIIMAEVNGIVFMAHDRRFVTKRAPTMYYDPTQAGIQELTATFAGTSLESVFESGESTESVAVANALRFRGVVRHLQYLVGWGFGTAAEDRPELLRISLPGEPTTFDVNAYFLAGDRNDPIIACGPSGSTGEEGGETLQVWKRTETHALTGYDRRTFGIRLIDSRFGIIASRAWLQVGGVAVAWSEEGPRAWAGIAASEPLEIPLALDAWEPADLIDEGDPAAAFTIYVPRTRVGWFVFGRRVYALTTRVPGRWRWSYTELGFEPYGAMTFFTAQEAAVPPPGIPSCQGNTPAGTYNDMEVLNQSILGDELLEVWIREVNSGSGGVIQEEADVFRGITNLSEFPVGAGVPAGITASGLDNPDAPDTFAIVNDAQEGNYFSIDGHSAFNAQSIFTFDSFDGDYWVGPNPGAGDPQIEILARVWIGPTSRSLHYAMGIGFVGDGDLATDLDIAGAVITKVAPDLSPNVAFLHSGNSGDVGGAFIAEAVQLGAWAWLRFRSHRNAGMVNWDVRSKLWYGDLADEPAGWTNERINVGWLQASHLDNERMGVWMMQAISPGIDQDEQRVAFFSWTTEWVNYPTLEPGDIPPSEGPWSLHTTVPVQSGTQTVRLEGLDAGQMYEVALRYRRGLLYSPGASDESDPTEWPAVSQCDFTTTINPPSLDALEWSRVDAGTEQIELTITPDDTTVDIEVWRALDGEAPTMLDTISAPHAAEVTYVDQTIAGETAYRYSVLHAGAVDSPLAPVSGGGVVGVRVWSGPPLVPIPIYVFPASQELFYGFDHNDDALDTEVWDNLPGWSQPAEPATGAHAFRAFVVGPGTEIVRNDVDFEPDDEVSWSWQLRHRQTAFTVTDFGEFTALQAAVFPP